MLSLCFRDYQQSKWQQQDLTRTRSFRIQSRNQQIFRPSDLVLGKLLGRGFFGQAFLVSNIFNYSFYDLIKHIFDIVIIICHLINIYVFLIHSPYPSQAALFKRVESLF